MKNKKSKNFSTIFKRIVSDFTPKKAIAPAIAILLVLTVGIIAVSANLLNEKDRNIAF